MHCNASYLNVRRCYRCLQYLQYLNFKTYNPIKQQGRNSNDSLLILLETTTIILNLTFLYSIRFILFPSCDKMKSRSVKKTLFIIDELPCIEKCFLFSIYYFLYSLSSPLFPYLHILHNPYMPECIIV